MSASFANAMKRIIQADVCTMAIDTVHIEKNTTVIHNEEIILALQLLPLTSEQVQLFSWPNDCQCEKGCKQCCVKFTLWVKEPGEITAKELTSGNDHVQVTPFAKSCMICKLNPGNELKLYAIAKRGCGSQHTKWNPTSICTFWPDPQVYYKLPCKLSVDQKKELARICPGKVFDQETGVVVRPENCIYCMDCVTKVESWGLPDALFVESRVGTYRWHVRTRQNLSVRHCLRQATQVLIKKLQNLENSC